MATYWTQSLTPTHGRTTPTMVPAGSNVPANLSTSFGSAAPVPSPRLDFPNPLSNISSGSLGKYVDAIPYLLDLLQSSEAEDRKAAALSLMKLEAKEAIQPLEEQLAAESDAALRKVLESAMSQIGRTLEEEDGW